MTCLPTDRRTGLSSSMTIEMNLLNMELAGDAPDKETQEQQCRLSEVGWVSWFLLLYGFDDLVPNTTHGEETVRPMDHNQHTDKDKSYQYISYGGGGVHGFTFISPTSRA